MSQTPPWAEKILTKYWATLVARGAPLPQELDTSTVKKRRAVGYGCGHYGCVMPTLTPGIVCKITSDLSEARFIRSALSLGEWPSGIVKYHAIYVLPETHKRRPVFIVYRDELLDGKTMFAGDFYRQDSRDYLRQLAEGITAFKVIAHEVRVVLNRSKNIKKTMEIVFKCGDWARDLAQEYTEGYIEREVQAYEFLRRIGYVGPEKVAILLAKLHDIGEHLEHNLPDGHVGKALNFYMEHNILLADVHLNNVGRVTMHDYDDPQWVISDPGHAVFLTDQYEQLLIEAL